MDKTFRRKKRGKWILKRLYFGHKTSEKWGGKKRKNIPESYFNICLRRLNLEHFEKKKKSTKYLFFF